uniref:Apoptosis inducing factor mitochondria associated 4 n=1 Tax=Astyanax mexicanus TaxID=7994 RepID=A0A8B9GWH6_ASTMX
MGPTSSREVTQLVCQESDLQDGQMKEVEIEQNKILLVRNEGKFSAVSGLCTHYGAPLIKGALVGNRVRCPWHGACFNTTTGDIEEFPGLDCLHSYKVKVDCGKVYVTASKQVMLHNVALMCLMCASTGPASLQCAETLRQNKYGGRIIMVIKDEKLPIDKTKLSKLMVFLLFCRARALQVPGAEMENVKLLESYKDAAGIYQMSVGNKVVIVGTSFIGMEVAAYLSDKAASVAVVGKSEFPYQLSLGPDIGKMTMKMLEEKNVKFYMNSGVAEMRGENGRVRIKHKNNLLLCVIPNSDFLKGSAVEVDSRNAVVVDKFMRTNIPDVFAAGDVVSFPLALREDKMVQIGHWQLAQAHGRVAALNMLKKQTEINSVPYFWTVLLGKSIRYTGYGEGYTDIVFKGNVEEMKFLAFYIKGDEAVAAASLNFDPAVSKVAELMASGQKITKSQAESQDLAWLQLP